MKTINAGIDSAIFSGEHFRFFAHLLAGTSGSSPLWPKLDHPAHWSGRDQRQGKAAFDDYLLELDAWLTEGDWFAAGLYAQAQSAPSILFAIRPALLSAEWHVFIFDPLVERARLGFPTLLAAAHFVLGQAIPISLGSTSETAPPQKTLNEPSDLSTSTKTTPCTTTHISRQITAAPIRSTSDVARCEKPQ